MKFEGKGTIQFTNVDGVTVNLELKGVLTFHASNRPAPVVHWQVGRAALPIDAQFDADMKSSKEPPK